MASKLLLPGIEVVKTDLNLAPRLKPKVKADRKVDAVSRSFGDAALTPLPDDAQSDDIAELEFEHDGRRWKQWVRVEQLDELGKKRVSRDGEETLFIPHAWELKETPRGIGTIALKALKIFGIDTDQFAEKGAKAIATSIADRFERDIAEQGHEFGLYRFQNPAQVERKDRITEENPLTGPGPFLIFLHGTASSSVGSFGKLAKTEEWEGIQKRYGDNILALDHRTFTDTPIKNALDLAKLLPDGAQLHLVSHSRGGLVGELICLAQAGESKAKFGDLTKKFLESAGDDKTLLEARREQLKQLEVLWEMLVKKRLNVRRFVRVACPARGTTLAGKRIDVLASGILNAIGMIPAIDQTPLVDVGYDWAKSLLLTLIKKKADPRDLPGIEAMIPDSPLIEFLNHPDLTTQADLAAISGDIEVGTLKLTIPALLGNAFFWARNDLVVNTKSMSLGIRRAQSAFDHFDQRPVVCHFNYFLNAESRKKLAEWLLREDEEPSIGFKPIIRVDRAARGASIESVSDWLEQEEPMIVTGINYDLRVSVTHGDLRHAKHPVAVGHYDGDGIISSESYVDHLLGGRLANRYGMRLYPGPVGTAAFVNAPAGQTFAGALVIGLGEMGDLSADVVRRGVMTATLQYALDVLERPIAGKPDAKKDAKSETAKKVGNAPPGYRSAAFSTLLIGTYGGTAMRVKEAATAILHGAMQTNRILQERGLWDFVRIDEVEFIELYEDVAIRAIRAIYEAEDLKTSDVAKGVTIKVVPPTLRTVPGGRYQRPTSDLDTYWYSRIQITASDDGPGGSSQSLIPRLPKIFTLNPEFRAAHRAFVDQLIEEATKTPKKRADLADMVVDLMQGKSSKGGSGSLTFEVLTDRARVEASMQATQRQLVDWMVEQTINKTEYDKDLSISLFELLIPNALKERTDNVVLQVDREAAQYPWELMTERSQPDRPLATRMGILRQFKTDDFRANPRPARGNTALVIGDTAKSGMAELPGAQEEASVVAQILKKDEMYVAIPLIKRDGKKIINELFAREYQILHIAAHGNFNQDNPDQSGVVLDDGRFLTAKELVNLRTIPDLVFVNCCHLGKMERLTTESPNRLAAGIAEELIKMGVKAVVAAGWAVDDAAAVTFARTFYTRMLAGESFGEAVLKARTETHEEHSDKNTWGAYQCYGNPNFRLNLRGAVSGKTDGLYSRREYRDALRSIAAIVDAQNVKRNESHREQLLKIEQDMPRALLQDGEVLSDFGEAWLTLGNFEDAIKFYDRAIRTDDARAALKSVERLANLHCRHATQLWEMHWTSRSRADLTAVDTDQIAEISRKINNAGRILDWLIRSEETDELFPGGNSERYALRGKVYKCEALIADSEEERDTKLAKARGSYHDGYLWAKKQNQIAKEQYEKAKAKKQNEKAKEQNEKNDWDRKDFIFPAVNVIACGLLLPEANREELKEIIKECRDALESGLLMGNNFWPRLTQSELDLLESLVQGDLVEIERQNEILNGYKAAIEAGWKPGEAESVLWQMQFLITILAEKDLVSARALSQIRTGLLQALDKKSR